MGTGGDERGGTAQATRSTPDGAAGRTVLAAERPCGRRAEAVGRVPGTGLRGISAYDHTIRRSGRPQGAARQAVTDAGVEVIEEDAYAYPPAGGDVLPELRIPLRHRPG